MKAFPLTGHYGNLFYRKKLFFPPASPVSCRCPIPTLYAHPCLQVPGLIWSKSHLPESLWGTSYDHMMHVTDWLPTLMSAVGGEITGRCVLALSCRNREENRGRTTDVPGLCSSSTCGTRDRIETSDARPVSPLCSISSMRGRIETRGIPASCSRSTAIACEGLDGSDGSSSVDEGRRWW